MASLHELGARHIQNMSEAKELEPHWGYADRALPCTNDKGSCEYLDLVYSAHDLGMLYTAIIWATILAILFIWAIIRYAGRPSSPPITLGVNPKAGLAKVRRSIGSFTRRYLLPDACRAIFGRTTRLQVVIMLSLVGYLTIWSFVGMTYQTWVTPVKTSPGVYNTRTTLGPWSDRIGVLAYALTPLTILLASRESILSLITGVPYQSFMFLHRWSGYLIFVQSALHTIGWCIVEIRLYQPQPTVAIEWVTQTYIIWGIVAMILLLLMLIGSTPWGIRATGYEFFRKSHYVLAMIYIGACWAHWVQLKCFLLPSLLFWFCDRGFRFLRTAYLHYHHLPSGSMGFQAAQAVMTRFPDSEHGDIVRFDLENDQDPWQVGQHYFLCFTESGIWQSHPFTPLNAPFVENGVVKHSYIMRARKGETKKMAELAAKKLETSERATTPIILTGAYGETTMDHVAPDTNIVCVAGGTGIAYVLPVLLELARSPISRDRKIELIWAIRHTSNAEWVQPEMDLLQQASKALNLKIRVYATRDASSRAGSQVRIDDEKNVSDTTRQVGSSSSSDVVDDSCACGTDIPVAKIGQGTVDEDRHPNLPKLITDFVSRTISGPTTVFASGPGGMISDLRTIVAGCNSGSKVWQGDERFDVKLVCDDRLEW
ncbi:ferric reductase FRE2 precursor [Fusarium heterosporum]|uniref:Ferric reductase FRE2 n=1 Tax=Fusarium heterosporum TaxID=42747 RepID=A0A8H5TEN0_FUSHE|nr:ferric reductase FRE2 precursor [Fusarium heterosporum]